MDVNYNATLVTITFTTIDISPVHIVLKIVRNLCSLPD